MILLNRKADFSRCPYTGRRYIISLPAIFWFLFCRRSIKQPNKKMKFVFYTLLLVTVCFSCNEDDDEPEVSIIGDWAGNRLDLKATTGGLTIYEETDEDFNGSISFKQDGTLVYSRDGVESAGTYTVADKKLTTDADFNLYNISGPVTFDIVTLTQTDLLLKLNETRQVTIPDVGEMPVTVTATLDFDR